MKNGKKHAVLLPLLMLLLMFPLAAQDLSDLGSVKPFAINGSIGLNSSFYTVSGAIPERQAPFAYGINAMATITVYGISMPFSFTWYNNNKAGFRQPFNQFGISPTYKWLTLHLGYRNLSFSEFTLNGYTFLGAGVEARPGLFRLGAVYGKFNQHNDYDLAMADSIPKLTRTGWATKVGYGTDDRFVDLSLLRIGDSPKNFTDSLAKQGQSTPAQNMAIGLTSKFRITPQLFFHFDGSVSFYTQNRLTAASDSVTDGMLRFAGHFITVNNSSAYHKALKTGLSYRFTPTIVSGFEYRRIDPGYQSMGSYFFNNDLEMYTFSQTASFLQNKINARGSLGLQRDNLGGTKAKRASRTIGSLAGNYAIDDHWAVDASYSNFSTSQKAIKQAANDSLKIFQVNHNLSLMPRFSTSSETRSQMVMLHLNWMKLDDRNKLTQEQTNTDTYIAMLLYNLGLLRQKLNLSAGLNYTEMVNLNYSNRLAGATLNMAKLLLKDKLSLNWNNSFLLNTLNNEKGTIFNTGLNASYNFLPNNAFTLHLNFIHNAFGDSAIVPSFHEIRGDIGYVYSF